MLKNLVNRAMGRYRGHPEAIIVSCFFNPMNSPYRVKAFEEFYRSIKHLPHKIVECVIGNGIPHLSHHRKDIELIQTESLLWHKEALLNQIIAKLPRKYKYVMWVDADVIFTNKDWVPEAVKILQTESLVQLFEYCVHLDKDEKRPSFDFEREKRYVSSALLRHPKVWKSFGSNVRSGGHSINNYDIHGHVGFAWGARREVLAECPLYDKALIGGADHIIAHASMGEWSHPCIVKAFEDDIKPIEEWGRKFYRAVKGHVGFVSGDLYHIWHGDIERREYLKRIQDFTIEAKKITEKDKNGLYTVKKPIPYMEEYYKNREVINKKGQHAPKKASVTPKKATRSRRTNSGGGSIKGTGTTVHNHVDNNDGFLMGYVYGSILTAPSETQHHHNDKCDHNNDGIPDNGSGNFS